MAYKVFSNGDALTGGELNTYLMNQAVISFATTTARDAALPSPSEGQLVWLEDSNKYVYYTGSAWSDLITPASSGNAIINGAFDIWQRGTSFTPAAGTAGYVADRWNYYRDGSGSAVTMSRQTFTPGTAPVAGYEGQYFFRFDQTTAGTGGTENLLQQYMEDVRTFAGQTVTVSFWAKADASRTLQSQIQQYFGSGGSSRVDQTAVSHSLTTSWARYTATFTVPSVAGKTINAGSYLTLAFRLPVNATGTFDIWGVQVEAGSTATAFKRNAPSIAAELATCKRYCRVLTNSGIDYGLPLTRNSATQAQTTLPLDVEMRTLPTLTTSIAQYGRVVFYDTSFTVATQNVSAIAIGDGMTNASVNLLFTHGSQAGSYIQSSFDTALNGSLMILSSEL